MGVAQSTATQVGKGGGGGGSSMREEHIQACLAESNREERLETEKWGKVLDIIQ